MRKLFSLILAGILAMLAGCGGAPAASTEAPAETTVPAGPALTSSWIGSHITTNAMGDVVSGHLLNFYDDGTVKIFYGIKAGVQGHHYGAYDGVYTDDGTVTYTYHRESEGDVEGTFQADLSADSFQAKIFCMASFPNSAGGGLHYVRIDPVELSEDAEYVYGGSKVTDDGTFAALLQLRDGVLTGNVAANGLTGTFTGSWEVVYSDVTDLDTPDRLFLRYAPLVLEETGIRAGEETAETASAFNDTSYLNCTILAEADAFPRIPMAAIVSQDGSRNP